MKRFFVLSLLLLHTGIGLAETAPTQEDAITIGKLRFGISNQELLVQQSTQEEQALLEKLRLLNDDAQPAPTATASGLAARAGHGARRLPC